MFAKSVTGSLLVLLALIVFFYGLRVLTQVYPVGQELLKWDRLLLMGAVVLWARAPWPRASWAWLHIGMSGLLVHGVYLGGVFTAIGRGLPAGLTALVVGLQGRFQEAETIARGDLSRRDGVSDAGGGCGNGGHVSRPAR